MEKNIKNRDSPVVNKALRPEFTDIMRIPRKGLPFYEFFSRI